jgi:hypothetical protein
MDKRKTGNDEWSVACRLGREAWGRVSSKPPGSLEFDREAWNEWLETVQRANEALHQCFGNPVRTSTSPLGPADGR